jgi:hypothetical protein
MAATRIVVVGVVASGVAVCVGAGYGWWPAVGAIIGGHGMIVEGLWW